MIHERGHDDRVLHQVVDWQRVEIVEIRVTAGAPDPVLKELETRQPGGVEGHMVGAANATRRDRPHAQVSERLHPGRERLSYVLVALQVDASILPGAVVLIEVHGELVVRRRRSDHRVVRVTEVALDVGPRPEEALLLARPQRHTDGAPRLDAHCLQEARRLQHHGHTRGVVAGVGAGVPGTQMRKELLREVAKSMKEESNHLRFDVGDFYDHASEDMERDLALTLSNREREKLVLIDDALKRIDEGTYGFCDVTGEKIGEDRLMAMPFTELSLEAQEEMERGEI